MPEIVEIKEYADFITNNIKNSDNKILNIKILNGRYKKHGPFNHFNLLIENLPLTIQEIKTKGKFMYWKFNDNLYFGISLGLFGGWLFIKNNNTLYPDFMNEFEKESKIKYSNHHNIEFKFKNGSLIYFDRLSFGSIMIFTSKDDLNKKLSKIGLDAMELDTKLEDFIEILTKKKNLDKAIGLVLLNQKVIAGIGNYLRADLLWLCKISPFRKVKDINNSEFKKLFYNIRMLTWNAYDYEKGVKLNIIKKSDKLDYKSDFLIYNKEKDKYGNTVHKDKLYEGNIIRHIYWVPKIQK